MLFSLIERPLTQSIIAALLIYIQAVMINRLVIKHRLGNVITLLPGLFYILITSIFDEQLMLSPSLIASTFMIVALSEMYTVYKQSHTALSVFNSGFCIGIATLLVPSLSIFVFFGIIAILILKSLSILDILQLIIGFVCSIYLYYSVSFLANYQLSGEVSKYYPSFNIVEISTLYSSPILLAFVVVLTTIGIVGYNKNMVKKSVQSQKKIDLFYYVMAFSLLAVLLIQSVHLSLVLIFCIPASILFSMYLLRIKSNGIQESLHLVAVVGILIYHFI